MKQIPFNHELLNTPGIVVKYRDGSTPDFVKVYEESLISINRKGFFHEHYMDGVKAQFRDGNGQNDLLMYRQTRTAEEVAREVQNQLHNEDSSFVPFENMEAKSRKARIKFVQAGMDEMKTDNP